jgi:integrase/recombinase XerD
MYKRGLIATHALDGLITPKRVRTEVYVPSQRTVISMLSVCDHSTKSGQLDRALVSCIADCAARRSELVAADVRDVDWDLGVIRIRQPAKDGLARWAPLGRTAREDLRRYVGHRSSGPLFLDRRFNRLSGKACLHRVVDTSVRAGADRRIGPQLLRRFAATQMTACATPEPLLYRIMGWSPDPRKVAWPAYVDLGPTEIARAFATISPVDQLVF